MLVRVQASSANPVDNSIAAGMLAQLGVEYEYPVTLGRDYAGVVEQVGAGVTGYAPGDDVFGLLLHANPTVRHGSWAELITVSADASIARRPTNVDVATAGAAPLAAITAVSAIDALDLSEGETVLIVGATGGVGNLAVQLAVQSGATNVAAALPETSGTSATYEAALKDGARVASPTGAAGEGPGRTMVMAHPTTANLDGVAQLLDSRTLTVPVQATYELDRAAEALHALATTHTQGKLAIRVS